MVFIGHAEYLIAHKVWYNKDMTSRIYEQLKDVLLQVNEFCTTEGTLNLPEIQRQAYHATPLLIDTLMKHTKLKEIFFITKGKTTIYNRDMFLEFITHKNFLANSYTKYSNKIGLTIDGKFMKANTDVVLNFPFKDCVLEGGQTKDETKQKEVFFNEVLAQEEIDRLFDKKVLTGGKRVSTAGDAPCLELKRDANGKITDNLIIKGNNLIALHTLKTQFAGKIKLIYIDPPYNTGNDSFNYNDNFNHSTWLTFMKNRLEIARELLRDDGVIFVQCDDNEQAYLKVLMDEIFGRENFVNHISAKMKNIAGASGGGEDKRLKKNIEYINIYAKNYFTLKLEHIYEYTEIGELLEYYKKENISWKYTSIIINSGEKQYLKSTVDGEKNEIKIFKRNNSIIKSVSQISKEENIAEKEVYYKYISQIFTTAMPQSSIRTRVLNALYDDNIENKENFDLISIEYIPKRGKNRGNIYEQFYKGKNLRLLTWLSDVIEIKEGIIFKKDLQGTFWDGFNLNNLSKEGNTIFESGKKPEDLVKKVIAISTQPSDIVLDFHLGSGTTAAVAHKMGRQYIGIEQMDYVEHIALERMKKVIGTPKQKEGELMPTLDYDTGGISQSVEWQGGGECVYLELKENTADMVERIGSAKDKAALKKIKDHIDQHSIFIDYRVKHEVLFKEDKDFDDLTLDEQKKILVSIFDKNQLYVNYSERDDALFNVSEDEKKLSKSFYGE